MKLTGAVAPQPTVHPEPPRVWCKAWDGPPVRDFVEIYYS